ncbi:MFS transporter [Pseudarthrobacter sp. NIBRBAC000502772]|uniref:MFS transporter n=1 Tax=Pseudarthrobacter sp. NIBRBAC000502772 TaxID=2590775 RepID=UPI001132966C|nr:MFS transporter [Pseudarthrobacter sp. NIBRBAC000502772]QDG66795.1 MFS transporter [Pseudarthrobacter sp. NIBRBAC000502772]
MPPREPMVLLGERIRADAAVQEVLHRRTLTVVAASQVLGGAGLAAGVTVGALLAQDMLGGNAAAGLPAALFTLGSALAAFLVGAVTQRLGRRTGLGLGFAAGALGALGVVAAAVLDSIPLLFLSLFIYGAGTATNLQARYAGTDLAPASRRGTAVSIAMVFTTLGAVLGPNLVDVLGRFAESLGIPALAGPFLLAAAAYASAGAVLFVLLRPDPFLLARELEIATPPPGTSDTPPAPVRAGTGVYVGAAVMVLTQIAMVAIMTMTPVHMRAHGHHLSEVGLVIGIHIGSMYLPSLFTGVLVDRIGRTPMAIASGLTLLAAGLTAATAPADNLGLLIVALALLGLGWNMGLISGTALVVDATVPAHRARTQGAVDVLIAVAGAGGGAMSGLVVAQTSYAVLSIVGGVLALLLIPVIFWARTRSGTLAAA